MSLCTHHVHEAKNCNEKRTFIVMIFTIITMIVEIFFGTITNSMALLADGFHMGTHVLALGLTCAAYFFIRKLEDSEKFPNGTNKIGDLAAYTSALFLALMGILIIAQSIERLLNPRTIVFNEAILVSIIGLTVNVICIFIMEFKNTRQHKHQESNIYKCHCLMHENQEDYNFKAAYYHILADALTSILAIVALCIGKYFNLIYFDALIGLLGGGLIIKWACHLLKKTTVILIDMKNS